MTKVILIGACTQCPYYSITNNADIYCNNEDLLLGEESIPKKIGNFVRINGIPNWCPLVSLDMIRD